MKFAVSAVGNGSTARPEPLVAVAQKAEALGFSPKPVQKPHPPLVFGGEAAAALKRAATLGDGWYGLQYTPDEVRPVVAKMRELRAAAGRDGAAFEISIGVQPEARPLTLDAVRRFADAGVGRLMVFAPGFVSRARFATDLDLQMEHFANAIIAKL